MKATIVLVLLAILSAPAFASEGLLHANSRDGDDVKEDGTPKQNASGIDFGWAFNRQVSKNIFGGLSVNQSNGADLTQVNLANYYIRLGDDLTKKDPATGKDEMDPKDPTGKTPKIVKNAPSIPFQLYITPSVAGSGANANAPSANQSKLLDPKSGTAIRVPLYWTYLGNQSGQVCKFSEREKFSCNAGFDFTVSTKTLTATDGSTQTPTVATARLGASFTLPIASDMLQDSLLKSSYLAVSIIGGRSLMSGGGDSSKLFTPVLNANGQPIAFQRAVSIYELNFALAVENVFSITIKRVGPTGANSYLSPQTVVQFDTLY